MGIKGGGAQPLGAFPLKRSSTILLEGSFVSYLRKGVGKDILLLHGYGSQKESFYYQTEFLSKSFRVTAPDFLGFGCSEPLTRPWSVGDYAEWLFKFIKAEGLALPHIVAHSFGARVAFKLLSAHPDIADKLVITGGAGLVKPRSPQYIRRVKAYRRVKRLFPRLAERRFGSEEYRRLSPLMKESYKKIVNEDLRDCAAKIRNKTLLIYGENDTVTPPDEEGSTFNSLICGSRLKIMPCCGHFCFSEEPELFNHLLAEFLFGQ